MDQPEGYEQQLKLVGKLECLERLGSRGCEGPKRQSGTGVLVVLVRRRSFGRGQVHTCSGSDH